MKRIFVKIIIRLKRKCNKFISLLQSIEERIVKRENPYLNRNIGSGDWGTHLAPLIAAIRATTGDVYEFGCGNFSTPVLHEILKDTGRNLYSFETDDDWLANFKDLNNSTHLVRYVHSWPMIRVASGSVVLIDHAPAERRIVDIIRLKDAAPILVVHDWEQQEYYQYHKANEHFKYIKVYHRFSKKTALLSNTIDVKTLIQ